MKPTPCSFPFEGISKKGAASLPTVGRVDGLHPSVGTSDGPIHHVEEEKDEKGKGTRSRDVGLVGGEETNSGMILTVNYPKAEITYRQCRYC